MPCLPSRATCPFSVSSTQTLPSGPTSTSDGEVSVGREADHRPALVDHPLHLSGAGVREVDGAVVPDGDGSGLALGRGEPAHARRTERRERRVEARRERPGRAHGRVRRLEARGRDRGELVAGRRPGQVEAGRPFDVDEADLDAVIAIGQNHAGRARSRRHAKQHRLIVQPEAGRAVGVDAEPVGAGLRRVDGAEPVDDVRTGQRGRIRRGARGVVPPGPARSARRDRCRSGRGRAARPPRAARGRVCWRGSALAPSCRAAPSGARPGWAPRRGPGRGTAGCRRASATVTSCPAPPIWTPFTSRVEPAGASSRKR